MWLESESAEKDKSNEKYLNDITTHANIGYQIRLMGVEDETRHNNLGGFSFLYLGLCH